MTSKRPKLTPDRSGYVSRTDVAKLIRYDLREKWPKIRFSIRCESYSGGGCINIRWTDGPPRTAVDNLVSRYKSSDFDGMIDLAFSWWHWLLPDGRIELAGTSGTVGSGGTCPAVDNPAPCDGCQRVKLQTVYVSLHREISEKGFELVQAAWTALSESERSKLYTTLALGRGIYGHPDSWHYDAELSDFSEHTRECVFGNLADSIPL